MTPAASKEGGQATAVAPDVCFIPAPPPPPLGPGGTPTPFPNLGACAQATKTSSKVLVRNKETLVEGSEIPSSRGGEAGCSTIVPPGQKGIVSMKNMAKVEFKRHSSKVKVEGKGMLVVSVPTTHNAGNTAGLLSAPSQTTVLASL